MNQESEDDWYGPERAAQRIVQAKAMREQAKKGGLRFEAYLPPEFADWILELIERGVFTDPSEAVFVILGEHRDLEPHADLREEILRRSCQAAMDDPRSGIPHEKMKEWLEELAARPRSEPAVWPRQKS
jgi:antitoxin ParD1/3/4